MSSLWLNSCRGDFTSQNGEDGVLDAIFACIGTQTKWCCEFGAWDGVHLSNTHSLLYQKDWFGLLIEADVEKYKRLAHGTLDNPRIFPVCERITPSSFENLLRLTDLPKDFDLLSIDIDGEDYLIWQALETYRPRVVVIEVNSGFRPDVLVVPEPGNAPHGASLRAMVELGKAKGYELALHTGNAIFVLREYADALGIDVSNWQELFDDSFALEKEQRG